MSLTSLVYYNQQWSKTDPNVTIAAFQITAATTVASLPIGPPVLPTFTALTQPQIDAFLGTSSEFLAAQFDATSMGTDAFAVLINMQGQAASAIFAEIALYPTAAVEAVAVSPALTHQKAAWFAGTISSTALAANIQYQLGADGNLAVKTVLPGIDALTTGLVVLKFAWISQ